ncbi:lactate/malate family dehydrogenase [Streptomyces chryseus]|uniref:lactate/malate family dehydrogenase n=1 Tax=Streptomyces chryseus TaxID=68186 RepID=UPI00110FE227|nr:lactate dehydrogenase [Streptomyces chryseus]GGW99742.1 L-lactate dehydrogenase [Streptomyces chryseus]
MSEVGVIGAGAVGQSLSTLLLTTRWCESVVVTSGSGGSAAGLVADLDDMREVTGSPVRVVHGDLERMASCDAVVVCPRAEFTNRASSDIRMAGLAANGPLIAAMGREFVGYRGAVIVVTNPVDVMSRLFAATSGCDRVFGVGSNTDTARYRLILARLLAVPTSAVAGHVIGEHGDHAVICASSTTVNGQHVPVPLQAVRDELAARPRRISSGIGRTRCGPAGATLAALEHALGHTDGVIELSAPWRGEWLGIPLRFTTGHPTVCIPPLDPGETRQLDAAASKIRSAYDQLHQTIKETTA